LADLHVITQKYLYVGVTKFSKRTFTTTKSLQHNKETSIFKISKHATIVLTNYLHDRNQGIKLFC